MDVCFYYHTWWQNNYHVLPECQDPNWLIPDQRLVDSPEEAEWPQRRTLTHRHVGIPNQKSGSLSCRLAGVMASISQAPPIHTTQPLAWTWKVGQAYQTFEESLNYGRQWLKQGQQT